MREESKLKEARFFHAHMVLEAHDRQAFLYYLSAFLSASRSVLQYALAEAKSKTNGQQWYNTQVDSSKSVSFFKNKRDVNIHDRPIQVAQRTVASLSDSIHISESVLVKLVDKNGRFSTVHSSPMPEPTQPDESSLSIKTNLVFRGWDGPEDAIELCEKYLSELERIVSDGQKRGFLSR